MKNRALSSYYFISRAVNYEEILVLFLPLAPEASGMNYQRRGRKMGKTICRLSSKISDKKHLAFLMTASKI